MREIRAVLAIDQAADSGVAMCELALPKKVRVGVMNNHGSRRVAIMGALQLAMTWPGLAVVFEDHSEVPAGKGRSTATILGMGAARGRWEEQLDMMGHPKSLRFKVTMSDWRARVLGVSKRLDSDSLKRAAMLHCERKYSQALIGHDAAEAACILEWAVITRPWEVKPCRTG
jgi:hypothetical protein